MKIAHCCLVSSPSATHFVVVIDVVAFLACLYYFSFLLVSSSSVKSHAQTSGMMTSRGSPIESWGSLQAQVGVSRMMDNLGRGRNNIRFGGNGEEYLIPQHHGN
jgi:hypothetical protein